MEFFFMEQLEQELDILYARLERAGEPEKQVIQKHIQMRNLRMSRMAPNE